MLTLLMVNKLNGQTQLRLETVKLFASSDSRFEIFQVLFFFTFEVNNVIMVPLNVFIF